MQQLFVAMLRIRLLSFVFLSFAFSATVSAHAASTSTVSDNRQQLSGLIREPLLLQVTLANGEPATLDAFVTRPVTTDRLPIVLITNGSSFSEAYDRMTAAPAEFSSTAIAFARHGYAAVTVLRQGYGQSSGPAEYDGSSCNAPRHERAGEIDKNNITAALDAIRRQPWASENQAILAGMSSGGFAVMATSAVNPTGVQAVINFDGGRGAIGGTDGKSFCDKAGLLKAFELYGRTARLPTLWLYAENDKAFSPDVAREMLNAYQRGGGNATFILMPPYENNGHTFMEDAPENFWWQQVADFLEQHHLPFREVAALPKTHLPYPARLNAAGRKEFSFYEASQRYEKAFAIDPSGSWGTAYSMRNTQNAVQLALTNCRKWQHPGAASCTVYAINNQVVAERPAGKPKD
ncbi:alpha/beta hydrolase family protein [Dickeya zeae]|uniref:Dienelactone hydrolase n=1 Tax=Dickeya zeae TaxID=204042 RepID=A0ABX8VUL8_9GAMM|nr:CocE/NonD family hydrolase [Dickeya zeae]MCO7262339.1 dienelactone hydrolase family protein [Dickeya zeae]QYM91619.1 dienelactone hydrolase [Dickeya zeae]